MTNRDARARRHLSIAYLNVGGLTINKYEFLYKALCENDVDVAGIAETWRDSIPWLEKYRIVAVKEAENVERCARKKDGIIIIAKKGLKIDVIPSVSEYGVCIRTNGERVLFIYKPPRVQVGQGFVCEGFLKDSDRFNDLILGDFNCRDGDEEEERLQDILNSGGIRKIKVEGSTFKRGGTSPDKVFANFLPAVHNIVADYTEHNMLLVKIIADDKRNFARYDLDLMRRKKDLITRRMEMLIKDDPPRKSVNAEFNRIENIFEQSFSCIKTKSTRKGLKHAPPVLKELRGMRNRIRKDKKRNLDELRAIRREIKEVVRAVKKKEGSFRKSTWRCLAEDERLVISAAASGRPKAAELSEAEVEDLVEKFVLKGNMNKISEIVSSFSDKDKRICVFQEGELESCIQNLPTNKAAGLSGLKNEFIKTATGSMKLRILGLFNAILEKEEVPVSWKEIVIHPIPKGENEFRPIALTDAFRKLFERMLISRMKLSLSDQQGGFRDGLAAMDQAVIFDDYLRKSNGTLKAAALDISKAYDSVDRKLLYKKLERSGASHHLIRILVSLLEGNRCRVRFGHHMSSCRNLVLGLPQGSIISPLLFNVFINDVVLSLQPEDRHKILLYADDILLFSYSSTSLQRLINCVSHHSRENNYQLNPKKSFYLSNENDCIMIDGIPIKKTNVLKYLGYYFNNKGFDTRRTVSAIRSYATFRTAIIKRGIANLYGAHYSPYRILCLMKVFVRPIFDYYLVAMGSYQSFVDTIESIQKKLLKYLFNLPPRTPSYILLALFPIESCCLRAEILAKNCVARINRNQHSNINRTLSSGRTKVLRWLNEVYQKLRDCNTSLLKDHEIDSNKIGLFGNSLKYDLKKLKKYSNWYEEVKNQIILEDDENGFIKPTHEKLERFIKKLYIEM